MNVPVEHVLPGDLVHVVGRLGTIVVDTVLIYDTALLPPAPELTRTYVIQYHRGATLRALRPFEGGHMLDVTRHDPEPSPPS